MTRASLLQTQQYLSSKQQENYFLSHSVGLPFKGTEAHFKAQYFDVWQQQTEPWPHWLSSVNNFRQQLAALLNAEVDNICPQSNLSSALTKVLFSLKVPKAHKNKLLYSAQDFPSMAFVLNQAKQLGYQLVCLDAAENLQDLNVWQKALQSDVALAFISHVQSNNGQKLPVSEIISIAKKQQVLTIIDVAQSVGIININAQKWQADFIIGSSVKWLCGGSGAGFLWVHSQRLADCQPVDVGWFSHQNPFEFDGEHFAYNQSALKFWGGTPTVAPFVIAGFAIEQVNKLGIETISTINKAHQVKIRTAIDDSFIVSPPTLEQSSGTLILHFKDQQTLVVERLQQANIGCDVRDLGIRLSPHFYTTTDEVNGLLNVLNNQ